MSDAPERDPRVVLGERVGHLTLVATEALYAEQPDLWRMGEEGRRGTFDDFGHHFRVLATLDPESVASHVRYCRNLFTQRGFPLRWLDDAWRTMTTVVRAELPAELASAAVEVLDAGVAAGTTAPATAEPE